MPAGKQALPRDPDTCPGPPSPLPRIMKFKVNLSQNKEKSSREERVQLRVQASAVILKAERPANSRDTEAWKCFCLFS